MVVLRAAHRLGATFGRGLRLSRLWTSPAWPPGSGGPFVNAVAILPRRVPPHAVLRRLHAIEAGMGRVRTVRWGPRVIDIDLIAVGRAVRPDPRTARRWMDLAPTAQARRAPDRLILPHPRMHDRGFVLGPMAERAGHWRHPLTGRGVAAMAARLPLDKRVGLRPLAPVRAVRKRDAAGHTLVKRR